MAPKKAKKGKKQTSDFQDLDDAEDIGLGDIPEPTAAAAKPKTSAPKKKKGKKALKAGDWSDEEPTVNEGAVLDDPEEFDEAAAAPQPPAAASTFTLLEGGSEEEEEEEEGRREESEGTSAAARDSKADDEHNDGTSELSEGIVCAEVTRIVKHPNADRLRICHLNLGSKTVQVVTNAPNIKEGMRTALALEGAQMPGSSIAVAAATVRGSKSFGMICSAFDLGWADAANGQAVRLPQDMKLGTALHSEPPEGFDPGAVEDDEPSVSEAGKKSSKKKKGSKGRAHAVTHAFSALGLEDEENGQEDVDDNGPAEDTSEQTHSAHGMANGTAADQQGQLSSDAPQQDGEQEEVAAVKPSKGKKKKGKLDIGGAFAALGLEDGENGVAENGDMNGDEAQSRANGHAEPTDAQAPQEPELSTSNLNGKKKQRKKGATDIDALLASMGEATADAETKPDASDADEAAASKLKEKKKKKERKPAGDVDALLAQLEGSTAPEEAGDTQSADGPAQPEEVAQAEAQADAQHEPPEASTKDKAKKKKKQPPAGKGADEDIDALLAEIGGDSSVREPEQRTDDSVTAVEESEEAPPAKDSAATATPAAQAPSKKSKKKKGKQEKEQADDDLDAILAELDGKPAPAQASSLADVSAPAATDEDGSAAQPTEEAENTAELSAAAKKKLKKKAKEKAKKAGGAAEDPAEAEEEEQAAPAAAAPKKGGKKVSAAVRRMQEALERQEREAEEAAQREAERKAAEEEAARIAEEEEARLAVEKEQRKADRAARRAEAKRQGLLLTGKAKKEAERLAAIREQLLRDSGVDVGGASPRDDAEKPAPKKVVYGKKKPAKKDSAPGDSADKAALEEQAALAERQAAEESTRRAQEEEARLAAEAAEKAQHEAEAAVQAADAESEDSDGDMNWEDMDLDAVKLPGAKKEELAAPEPPKRPAKDDEAEDVTAAAAKKQKQAPEAGAEPADEGEEGEDDEDGDEDTDEDSEEESEEETSDEESSDEDSSSYESSSVDSDEEREERLARQKEMREARLKAAMESGSKDHLRSPICCILGHVDTGKTKLLDNVRRTNVQEGEAGGITQQIGATYVPGEAIAARTESLRKGRDFEMKMPGLLIIDTPGHESFTNLRSRGSGLCDIAILVVDLMHGLEPQTIESIELLKMRKTPFIIALNKVDRLYAWKSNKDAPMKESLDKQSEHTMSEFKDRMKKSMLDLNEQGLNVALYWENPDIRKYVNIVPTSAITGEGIPDLLQLLVKLTQAMMAQRLMFISELQCTVLEVKVIEGLGTTIDVVLVNGVLHEGDQIVVCGLNGAIATNIRSLLTPHPLKELRVKGSYLHHKEITAAQGVKIAAPGLENAVAGTQLLVVGKEDDVSLLKEEVMQDMESIFDSVDRSGEGVCVQASTLGSLEALLEFLRSQKEPIPVSSIAIGPIHRKDVMRAKVMLEKGCKKFGIILAFDVPVTREAQELADKEGVRIMRADIIYHLFDQFTAYCKEVKEHEQEGAKLDAVFPCILKILPTCVFNKKDPIVVGADVVEGIAKVGTPLCIPSQGGIDIGRIASMEINHVAVEKAKRGDSIALKVEATNTAESSRLYGRHFDHKDDLVSRISRKSINLLKEHFKDELSKDDWRLVLKLKKVFNID